MKHIFVHNPIAGKDSTKAMDALREQIQKYNGTVDYEFYSTTAPGDATAFVKARCEAEPETALRFYACGGDGTANEVLHGVIGHDNASMTCYPCGSGNDFVKYYGGATRFLNLDTLLVAKERCIDIMKIGDRYSLNVTNFGFDTAVVRTMEKMRHKKVFGGKSAYYAGIVKALFTAMKNDCTVSVDGERLNDGKMLLCTVSNGSHVGGSFHCAPHSSNEDGLLEICLVRPISRFKLLKLISVYKEGGHLDDPRFRNIIAYRRGKSVHITAPEGFAYSLDGEVVECNDFTIEVCPGALRFAVPIDPNATKEESDKEAAATAPEIAKKTEKCPETV